VRQVGPYLTWVKDDCGGLPLVREDWGGRSSGVPVVTLVAALGS
jgi:hypothetical protein